MLLLAACTAQNPPDTSKLPEEQDSPVGHVVDGTLTQTTGSRPAAWLRDEVAAPGSITFNEISYHPLDAEWIELHNPMALDMDVSGWTLDAGVPYTFPDGTVIPAGGYLVVTDVSFGTLDNAGERIELHNNGGRLIDTIEYGNDDPWPVAADGTGLTLAKIDPDAASDHAENWTASAEIGGTPGQANLLDPLALSTTVELVAADATWAYDDGGAYPAADWASASYDDGAWPRGDATFYAGGAVDDAPASIRATADNYYSLYLGAADGSDLRLIGQDGDWTTVEQVDVDVHPDDHLYVAAWEASSDSGGPQMMIAEAELAESMVGTSAAGFEWILGPVGACPDGGVPDLATLSLLVDDANSLGTWAAPGAEDDRTAATWGWAVSASFHDGTNYIWPDTFDDPSITNTDTTYALFRSVEPLQAARGTTELATVATTTLFRTPFTLDADPAATTLGLDCQLDDGAVVYVNGVEVARENLPGGAIAASTLASTAASGTVHFDVATDAIVRGTNVLAVELHQAQAADPDLLFGCSLTATITASTSSPPVVLNEVAASDASPFWVELAATSTQDLAGMTLRGESGEYTLPAGDLDGLAVVDDLGFTPANGEVLALISADGTQVLDAVRVQSRPRGRDGDAWRWVTEETPGEPNVVTYTDSVVINEIQYHPLAGDEWIELYNRGAEPVDLGGWQLADAVAYDIPAGTTLAPDSYLVIDGFTGRLDNAHDRVLLLDDRGNPADEVHYYDGGRWPEAADGGGSTLELRDPRADNSAAEAWAASEQGGAWATYSYRGTATASAVGPDGTWNELVFGLLDRGEVLIDDLSVIEDPDGAAREIVQNGSFDAGSDHWRLLGNHRHSELVPDPDDPGNTVLRLVATGAEGHMHNHVETTLTRTISATEYTISYRARWVSGSNQLNTRLYFNRLPRTTLIDRPTDAGTPGAANSVHVDNAGPTFADLHQDVAVPAAGQAVAVSVTVDDPDGVDTVTVWSSVDGAAFQSQPMLEGADGVWQATLPGQAAGAIVQLYVEAVDARGASATFPAAGPDSRALYKVDDGLAETNGLHNFRILMTDADSDWMLDDINVMSDDLVGATIVYDEAKVFYDVGVRAKGSERGRPEVARLGYGVTFHPDEPFRGSHTSVLVDRSEGVGTGQREVLMNLVMTHAGAVSGEYNDLIQALTPRAEHTGPAELQLDRFSSLVLASQFTDGDAGELFEYELIYYPVSTDDGTAEGYKLPQPDGVVGTYLTDLGDDKEAYRWNFLLQNNEGDDDYTRLIALAQGLSGPDAADLIDVDEWLRAFAFATLSGAVDNYGGDGSQHNARFYARPDDGRMLYFPHDLDYFGSSTMAVVGNGDLSRLLQDPVYLRAYYGHLYDVVNTAYNADYLAPWCDQMGALLPAQNFDANCQFIADRADWVMYGASDSVMNRFPTVDFRITTADQEVEATEIVVEGVGWVDVRGISLAGAPLAVTWVDDERWQVTVPLVEGENTIELVATDYQGTEVGADTIVVTAR